MKLIVRNPFITKERRDEARIQLKLSTLYAGLADDARAGKLVKQESMYDYTSRATKSLFRAARLLGFLNPMDMAEYMEIHKKLP